MPGVFRESAIQYVSCQLCGAQVERGTEIIGLDGTPRCSPCGGRFSRIPVRERADNGELLDLFNAIIDLPFRAGDWIVARFRQRS